MSTYIARILRIIFLASDDIKQDGRAEETASLRQEKQKGDNNLFVICSFDAKHVGKIEDESVSVAKETQKLVVNARQDFHFSAVCAARYGGETPKMLSEKAPRVIAVVNNWNSCLERRARNAVLRAVSNVE